MNQKPTVLFLSHGGGPLPLLGDPGHTEMLACLEDIVGKIPKPSAILLISAHWEESVPTITSGEKPKLIYDYYGFPEESYSIEYPCSGEPVLAKKLNQVLKSASFEAKLDSQRGFDHGLFVPLKIMFPKAEIPCVQLSLINNLDSKKHIQLGKVLQNIDYENLLIIGSGFSFHNLRAFFTSSNNKVDEANVAFENWLLETCSSKSIGEEKRETRLIDWDSAPGARVCHPREEHLLPLHVCYGVAGRACTESFELDILGKKSSMYLWSV